MRPKFPLYLNDDRPVISMTKVQTDARNSFLEKIASGVYKYEKNHCVCGADADDTVIAEKDRYGIPIVNLLCNNCGVVRSELKLDANSIQLFYKNEYRKIYGGSSVSSDSFFSDQVRRGRRIFDLLDEIGVLPNISNVFEIGCGAGGILYPFQKNGLKVKGCDYGEKYLEYGRKKGLELHEGNIIESIENNSIDLLLLIHVFEHFEDPLSEMVKIFDKIKLGGYILIEVPSLLNIHKVYYKPIRYFQNAHIYNYHQLFLKYFFENLGLQITYSDELTIFVLKKTKTNIPNPIAPIKPTQELKQASKDIAQYLQRCYFRYDILNLHAGYKVYNFLYRIIKYKNKKS